MDGSRRRVQFYIFPFNFIFFRYTEEKTMDATLSKLTTMALSKAFTTEKKVKPAKHESVVAEVGQTIKSVVKTITG